MTPQELEACVLAGLLNGGASPDAFDVIASTPEESFSIGFHRRAFYEIKKQALANGLIDMLFVSEALGGSSLADLSEITRMPATVPNLKGYAGKMVKAWRSRRMAELLQQGADGIRQANNQEQRDQVVETAVAQLLDMTGDTGDVQPVHMSELLPVYMETMQKRMDGEEGTRNLKTGIEELDDATGGINLQDLIVVAGRPGMGKTEFALKIVDGVTAAGGGALIFSMEMAAAQIVERSLAGSGNMSVSRLRNPLDMQDEDWARFTAAMETMNGRDIWIVDATDLTIEQIRAVAETHKRRYPHLAMIVVDYLGLIKKPKAERNDLAIAHISRNLKRLCACIRRRSRLASFRAPWIPVLRASVARLCQTSATPVLSSRTPTASCSCTAMKSTTLKARLRGSPKLSWGKVDSVLLVPLSIRSLKTATSCTLISMSAKRKPAFNWRQQNHENNRVNIQRSTTPMHFNCA